MCEMCVKCVCDLERESKPKEKTFKLELLDWIDETKIIESYLKENLTIQ